MPFVQQKHGLTFLCLGGPENFEIGQLCAVRVGFIIQQTKKNYPCKECIQNLVRGVSQSVPMSGKCCGPCRIFLAIYATIVLLVKLYLIFKWALFPSVHSFVESKLGFEGILPNYQEGIIVGV